MKVLPKTPPLKKKKEKKKKTANKTKQNEIKNNQKKELLNPYVKKSSRFTILFPFVFIERVPNCL